MNIYHKHHIIPKHFGGSNDPKNLIKLTIAEHAAWHYELWVYYGKIEDYCAWQGLLGNIGKDEIFRLLFTGKNNPNYGNKWTQQQKRDQSNKLLGRFIGILNPFYGKKHTVETKNHLSNKKMNIPHPESSIIKQSKTYTIINPHGLKYQITNLSKFCRENNLNQGCMSNVASGKSSNHKNWLCYNT